MSNIIPKWLRDTLKTQLQDYTMTDTSTSLNHSIKWTKGTTVFNWIKPKTALEQMQEHKTGIFTPYTKKKEAYQPPKPLAVWGTGSRYICDPPVMDTDDDSIILVSELPLVGGMKSIGWEVDLDKSYAEKKQTYTGHDYGVLWISFRSGQKNLIYMTDKERYVRMAAATELAKKMNLVDKNDRVNLFQFIQGEGNFKKSTPLPDRGFI